MRGGGDCVRISYGSGGGVVYKNNMLDVFQHFKEPY